MIPATSPLMHFFIKTLNWCYIKRGMMALTLHTPIQGWYLRLTSFIQIAEVVSSLTQSLFLFSFCSLPGLKIALPSLFLCFSVYISTQKGEGSTSGLATQPSIWSITRRRGGLQCREALCLNVSAMLFLLWSSYLSISLQYSLSTIIFLLRPHIKWKG